MEPFRSADLAIGYRLLAIAPKALVRLPGVAPGHSPWRGDILLLNHSRMESNRAGSCVSLVAVRKDLPARAISTKNKHLLLSR